VTFYRKATSQEATWGTEVIQWQPLAYLPGSPAVAEKFAVELMDDLPSRSMERADAGVQVGLRRTRLRMRWRGDIDASMQVVVHRETDETWQIVGGPAEGGGRKRLSRNGARKGYDAGGRGVNDLVHVKGLSDLQRFLDTLPAKMEQNVLRSALRQGANVIMAEAKQRVSVVSGKLRDSIRVSVSARRGKVTHQCARVPARRRRRCARRGAAGWRSTTTTPSTRRGSSTGTAAHFIGVKYAKALVLRPNVRASSGFAKRLMRAGVLVEGVHHPGARPRPFLRPAMDTKAQEALVAVGNAIKARLAVKHGLDTSASRFQHERFGHCHDAAARGDRAYRNAAIGSGSANPRRRAARRNRATGNRMS
jgi:hypothetical protein